MLGSVKSSYLTVVVSKTDVVQQKNASIEIYLFIDMFFNSFLMLHIV